ncbi:MAG: hypothetical protein KBT22_10250 [Bacteroidales bacterium]|nr:hypothetical protein [Candidatus Scybalocola fimicaballi]
MIEPNRNGDLGQLGLLPFDLGYHRSIKGMWMDSLYEKHIDNLEFSQTECDSTILIIGDSFSEQERGGFTNFLTEFFPGYKVCVLWTGDGEITKYQLFINRLLEDKPLPRTVIIESVERHLTNNLYLLDMEAHPEIEKNVPSADPETKPTTVKEPESSKIKEMANSIVECKDDLKDNFLHTQEYVKRNVGVADNPVKHLKLKQELFTCKGAEDDLYFYWEDLEKVDKSKIDKAKQNLDALMSATEKKGIKILFVVPSDKYDLYKDFAKKNKNKKVKPQLDFYTEYNSNSRFLNCKELLYPHVANGEKDIYKCHDSHWSPIGAKYAAEEIKRKLDSQK